MKFFVDVRAHLTRDYIVILDQSGSMSGSRWTQAQDAVMKIAPWCCQADPDGITLYLFNSRHTSYRNLQRPEQIAQIFTREKPSGTTNLAGVLNAAFAEHFSTGKPTTILVITDGEPDNQGTVIHEIVQATTRMRTDEQLSVSFIQIGNDAAAQRFLEFLDNNLQPKGARFDIVDTLSASAIGSIPFDQLIARSIFD